MPRLILYPCTIQARVTQKTRDQFYQIAVEQEIPPSELFRRVIKKFLHQQSAKTRNKCKSLDNVKKSE